MKRSMMTVAGLVSILALSACGGSTEPAAIPEGPVAAPAEPAPVPPPEAGGKDDDGGRSDINISADIRAACGITDTEALFGYDSSKVQKGSVPTLDKLAACFATGALAGRKMRLVGHADPRGDEEYNMVLGGRRSDSVKTYLVRAGLQESQAESTSRGEMDATGTDDASWGKDRRVDVVLAN
ncbi:MAG: hypothetical protein RJA70_2402 [Pseudomonadota bacterium]|jgi:peptidoglycan-associated lipoprotein